MPQSSQNADEGAFSAPHFGQLRDSGLPHAAQNFLLVVLSVPHLVQRMRLILRDSDGSPSFIIQHRAATSRLRKDHRDMYQPYLPTNCARMIDSQPIHCSIRCGCRIGKSARF